MKGYLKILKETKEGKTLRNRRGRCTLLKRRFMKLVGMSEWFRIRDTEPETVELMNIRKPMRKKKQNDNRYIEAIFYVPHTPNSTLKSKLTRMKTNLGFRTNVKYEEELRRLIAGDLINKDPYPVDCECPDCFSCQSKPGLCKRPGLVYNMICKVCKETGKT